ncbi:hypothetical protein KKI24_06145 [bacterium]|nr:hypothetical protein [bacterium]
MDEDLLETRFSSESIQFFLKSLADFESVLPVRSYDTPIHFFGSFDKKSQTAIQNLVNESFVTAEKHGLRIEHHSPEVSFYTPSSWAVESGKPLKKQSTLPAARLTWKNGVPFVEVIIPEKITSSEEVIKTVRLLFSKLFGLLFFNEHVPQKPAFRLMVDETETLTFDRMEKIHFCHFLDRYSPALVKEFDRIGRTLQIKGPKSREYGKTAFFKNLLQSEQPVESTIQKLIDDTFQKHLESLQENPTTVYDELVGKFFSINPQTTVLLPYDLKNYHVLAQKQQWTIFHAFEERLQLINNSMSELADCRDYLTKTPEQAAQAYAVLDAWKITFSERIKVLKRRGLAKPFLIEGAKLSEKQKDARDRFPLWIWQHCRPDIKTAGRNTGAIVTKLSDQYKNSVYQKLFEAALRMHTCLNAIQSGEKKRLSDCADFPRIKTILAWLEIRKTTYNDMLVTSKVGSQLGNLSKKRKTGKTEILKIFEQGWSYFVSFAMVHQYYLALRHRSHQSKDRSEQFFSLIERYVQARIADQHSFQISGLLLEFYKKRQHNLKKVSELLRKDTQILDFFILNQSDIFQDQSRSPAETIDHFSGSLIQWQDKREEQAIQQEELAAIRVSKTQ